MGMQEHERKDGAMEQLVTAIPILPGQLEAWKELTRDASGPRRGEYDAWCRQAGVVREVIGLEQTPQGDFACIFFEAEDIGRLFSYAADSQEPFAVWFRSRLEEIHGIDDQMLRQPWSSNIHFEYRRDGQE